MRGKTNFESVDLIVPVTRPSTPTGTTTAPIGSEAAGAAFKDTWTLNDVDLAIGHGLSL